MKILVVEDTQENLEVAKKFFSKISDHEFFFATNRQEAELLIPKVDALITDVNFPFSENEFSDVEDGYILAVYAFLKGKKVVLISSHGNFLAIAEVIVNNSELENLIIQIKNYDPGFKDINDYVEQCLGIPLREYDFHKRNLFESSISFGRGAISGISKTDPWAWRQVWERLLRQIK